MNKMQTEPMTGDAMDDAPKVRRRVKIAEKGGLRTLLMLIVPAVLLLAGGYYWLTSGGSVSTDNAQVKQDIVAVSPQVNGPVSEVAIKNGDRVRRGHHRRKRQSSDQAQRAGAPAGAAEARLHHPLRL